MGCITPMFYYYKIGDKKHGKIIPRTEVLNNLYYDPNYIRQCLKTKNASISHTGYKYIQVPCQKCWACQLKYSGEWATRIIKEAEKYQNNWYVTLTYDDINLPIAEKTEWDQYDPDPKDPFGEKIMTHQVRYNDGTWTGTLNPEDMDRFLNSLRKHLRDQGHEGLKYFYCGEYGSQTGRPHYHIILLNCPLDPIKFYSPHIDGKNFKAHWKSQELDSLWATGDKHHRKPKGIIDVAELEWSCAAYVARYCTKKLFGSGDKTQYLENGKLPEFIRMSKGIAFDYFNENYKEIYKNDEIIMRTVKGNVGAIKPPKAFDRKLSIINPKLYEKIKKSREKAADRAAEIIESLSDATDWQKLIIKAEQLETKMSLLPRIGEW